MLPPTYPLIGANVSSTASILAASTTTVAVAVSQLVGFNFSQIVYVYVYVPAGVCGATVIVPSGFIVKPGLLDVPGVKVTCDGFTGWPFNVSLSNTLGVLPPT